MGRRKSIAPNKSLESISLNKSTLILGRDIILGQSVLISAIFAGLVATLVTVAIEKWGGLTGGILGTIPSTIVPAAAGMYIVGGEIALIKSMAIIPLGMLVNGIFLTVWIILPPHLSQKANPLLITTISALIIWTLSAIIMLKVADIALDNDLSPGTLGLIGLLMLLFLSVIVNWRATETPKGKHPVSLIVLICRGLAAAIAIAIAVWLSSQGQPLVAGIAAVFPAIFLTSMVALWMAQGPTVPRGAAGPMMLGGVSVAVYAIVSIWALPQYGVLFGSAIAWIIAVIGWSIPAYVILSKRNTSIGLKA